MREHPQERHLSSPRQLVSHVVVGAAIACTLTACGAGDAPDGFGQGDGHSDIEIGSSQADGGALVLHFGDEDHVEVTPSVCLGGSGELCDGGIWVFQSEDPGFGPVEEDEVEEAIFALPAGVVVFVEIVAIDDGASLTIGNATLSSPGDDAVLGTSLEGLHVHGVWRAAVSGGAEPSQELRISFRITTNDLGFEDSEELELVLVPTLEHDDEHDDEHDH
jgi:hypothetical protein